MTIHIKAKSEYNGSEKWQPFGLFPTTYRDLDLIPWLSRPRKSEFNFHDLPGSVHRHGRTTVQCHISAVTRMSDAWTHRWVGHVRDWATRYLTDHLIPASDAASRCLRLRSANLNRLTVPRCRLSTYGCRAFYHAGPTVWNPLPDELGNSGSFNGLTIQPLLVWPEHLRSSNQMCNKILFSAY